MIPEVVAEFDKNRQALFDVFKKAHPETYAELVKAVVQLMQPLGMDPGRITEIDHGDYQGDKLFIIAKQGYQPSEYWATQVGYGSCSACDSLLGISGYTSAPPTDEQARDYVTLALHIVQSLKKIF